MNGSLLVCGTASHVGKSRIVAGLCRALVRRGVSVAPFKAQNMSNNSFVTADGREIARSQAHQAWAARTEASVAMNPVLLKPMADARSQLIVMGRPVGDIEAAEFGRRLPGVRPVVHEAWRELRERFDVVVAEGAGGAAEINLLDHDLANLALAAEFEIPTLMVGDIDRGGAFAALYGTMTLLPASLRSPIRGFVINKFRGRRALLEGGIEELERRTGVGCFGVLPHLDTLPIDEEDSLSLDEQLAAPHQGEGDVLDVAVVRLPHLANFTDFDPLAFEPSVRLRYVSSPRALRDADVVVLPGSRATVSDLAWLRARGFDQALVAAHRNASVLVGICAGYQMLGRTIHDMIESRAGSVRGLGMIPVDTTFHAQKRAGQRCGIVASGAAVCGFEIRHGRPQPDPSCTPWISLSWGGRSGKEGVADEDGGIYATNLHGIFEENRFRREFLEQVAARRHKHLLEARLDFAALRDAQIDRVADMIEAHLDLERVCGLIDRGKLR